MSVRKIALRNLSVNRANDRHGELENETAAIAWLFNNREIHMKNLAKDIVKEGKIYEMPLVSPEGDKFLVFDGNRRVTCLKLLSDPRRAPTSELQKFFNDLKADWKSTPLEPVECQVETDRERIDEILYRRHTGTQNGVGQSTWDDRIKAIFVARTGKASGFNVADEIEKRLEIARLLPSRRKIPRSTMNRFLSAEAFRNRIGFSMAKGQFAFTHDEDIVLQALARIANDLANRTKVLGDFWDVDGKRAYLDELECDGVLPTAQHALSKSRAQPPRPQPVPPKIKPTPAPKPQKRTTLIPQIDFGISWPGRLQRHHQIWEELQFHLELGKHPNAISVLFRVLIELAVENYIKQAALQIPEGDKLAARVLKVGKDLEKKNKLDAKAVGLLNKFQHSEKLISADTLNRYVHSANLVPSPDHLTSLWDSLAEFVVLCLQA